MIDVGDNTGAAASTDYDGAPRVQDADYNGTATVDMGAFEFSPDFDGDGTPDWQDPDRTTTACPNAPIAPLRHGRQPDFPTLSPATSGWRRTGT